MNYINLYKLMYTPIDQTKKNFSCFYPKEWITEFVKNKFEYLPIGIRNELNTLGTYNIENVIHLLDIPFSIGLGFAVSYLELRVVFSGWICKDENKIEIVLNRINHYLIFELDYDKWTTPPGILPKTPEEVADLFEYVKEVG